MAITTEFSELKTVSVEERELKKDRISLRLSDNKSVGFSKVLEKRAELFIENSDVTDDTLSYTLGVNTSVIFIDLKGEIRQASYSGSVQRTLSIDGIKLGDDVVLRPVAGELEIDKIVGEDLTLVLDYTLFGLIFENNTVSALTTLSGGYSRTLEAKYITFEKSGRSDLSLETSLDVVRDFASVLSSRSRVTDCRATAKTDSIELHGTVIAEVTYLTEGDNNEIVTLSRSFDFVESVEFPAAMSGDEVLVFFSPKMTFVNYSEDEKTFDVRADFVLTATVLRKDRTDIISEVFSKKYELLPSVEITGFDSFVGIISAESGDSATYSIEDLNNVVATLCARAEIINTTVNDRSVDVDVLAKIDGIVDIDGSYISREFDVPVTVTVPTDGEERIYVPTCVVTAKELVKNTDSVTATVKIRVALIAFCQETLPVITKLTVGEEKPRNGKAIVVYIAKGDESEIDLAKAVNLTPDEIAMQETLEYPLKENQRVVLYRQNRADEKEE